MCVWGGVHTFTMKISPKVDIIAWLEFKLAYFEAAVHHFSLYANGILPFMVVKSLKETYITVSYKGSKMAKVSIEYDVNSHHTKSHHTTFESG